MSEHMSLDDFRKLTAEREAKFKKDHSRKPLAKKSDGTVRAKPVQREGALQEAVMRFLHGEKQRKSILAPVYDLIYHVPNGGHRSFKTSKDLKKQGVKKGVSDLVLPIAKGGYFGLYLEIKAEKRWSISESQKEWLSMVEASGYAAALAVGEQEIKDVLVRYMSMPDTVIQPIHRCEVGGTDWRELDGKAEGK